MNENLRADGIKLSLEMTLVTIRTSSGGLDPNARFLKLMGENRINLPFLCSAARDDTTVSTYCILTEDITRANNVIASDKTVMTHIEYLPSVGTISVFPHNFNLAFFGMILRLMGELEAPLHGLATSISALCMVTDFSLLEQIAGYLARYVSLPGNHSPFNPDISIKSI